MSFWIRPAKLSDLDSLAELHLHASGEALESPAHQKRLEFWQHILGGGARRTHVWVAFEPEVSPEGKPLGFIVAGGARILAPRFQSEVTALYVAPEVQRKGLGSRLLAHAIEELRQADNALTLMAWVKPASPGARFLEKNGWKFDPSLSRQRLGETELAAHL